MTDSGQNWTSDKFCQGKILQIPNMCFLQTETYFLKHSLSKESTCFNPFVPNSWTHSKELFVKATLKDSIQLYFFGKLNSELLRY